MSPCVGCADFSYQTTWCIAGIKQLGNASELTVLQWLPPDPPSLAPGTPTEAARALPCSFTSCPGLDATSPCCMISSCQTGVWPIDAPAAACSVP
jgi:hypothetical protein